VVHHAIIAQNSHGGFGVGDGGVDAAGGQPALRLPMPRRLDQERRLRVHSSIIVLHVAERFPKKEEIVLQGDKRTSETKLLQQRRNSDGETSLRRGSNH